MDDASTLKKFKEELKAPFAFIPDPDGKVGRKILKVETGKDAIDPSGAVEACPLRKPGSKPDAGTPPDAGTR